MSGCGLAGGWKTKRACPRIDPAHSGLDIINKLHWRLHKVQMVIRDQLLERQRFLRSGVPEWGRRPLREPVWLNAPCTVPSGTVWKHVRLGESQRHGFQQRSYFRDILSAWPSTWPITRHSLTTALWILPRLTKRQSKKSFKKVFLIKK